MTTENGVRTKASSSLWRSGSGLCSGVNTSLGLVTSVPLITSALPIVWMSGLRRLLKGRVFLHSIHSFTRLFICVLCVCVCVVGAHMPWLTGRSQKTSRGSQFFSSAMWILGIKLHRSGSGLAASTCIYGVVSSVLHLVSVDDSCVLLHGHLSIRTNEQLTVCPG